MTEQKLEEYLGSRYNKKQIQNMFRLILMYQYRGSYTEHKAKQEFNWFVDWLKDNRIYLKED